MAGLDDRARRVSSGAARPDDERVAAHGLRSRADRARWEARARFAEHVAYLPFARRRHGNAVVSADTELVIDGYPRTAGTFAVVAFHLAQPHPVRVAHHLHAPAQILRAVALGVPTLVTVREPERAVLSGIVRQPYLTIGGQLRAYTRFHRAVKRVREGVVVATFDETTTCLGGVVERVNERFGTHFAPFEHTPENVAACFELIELRSRRPEWRRAIQDYLCGLISLEEFREIEASHPDQGAPIAEHRVARPSEQRSAVRERLAREYRSDRYTRLREQAEAAYLAVAGTTPAPEEALRPAPAVVSPHPPPRTT
jgi:hypothetical protein